MNPIFELLYSTHVAPLATSYRLWTKDFCDPHIVINDKVEQLLKRKGPMMVIMCDLVTVQMSFKIILIRVN